MPAWHTPPIGAMSRRKRTPGLAYCLKYRVKLTWRLHVTGQEDRRLQLSRERLDVGLGLVVTLGNGEILRDSHRRRAGDRH